MIDTFAKKLGGVLQDDLAFKEKQKKEQAELKAAAAKGETA